MEQIKAVGFVVEGESQILADICTQFNLNIKTLIRDLSKVRIKADDGLTIKKIAANNPAGSIDIYEQIKAASLGQISD